MLPILISIVGILITIFFVIGTHESAHFLMARLCRVKVLRFSIGFGKTIFRRTDKRGTEYVIALIPLGGYVSMLDEHEGQVPASELPFAYNRQPFYKKCLIVLAGPATNILCAFLLYWFIFMMGFITIKPMIGDITPRSIAMESGLKAKQEIISIDHHPIQSWMSVVFRLLMHVGSPEPLTITATLPHSSNTQDYSLDVSNWHLDKLTPDPLTTLGIKPYSPLGPVYAWPKNMLRHVQYGPFSALAPAWRQIIDLSYFNLYLLGKIVTGQLSVQSLGGPITIFQSAGNAFHYGLLPFMSFLAFLSISIGVINLLPIPGLDGGHLFIQLIEVIIRRPISERVLLLLYRLGFALIIFVLIQALINDIFRMV
jgi:regulator of sigma E protease